MTSIAALLAESDAALGALAGVADEQAPGVARDAAERLGALALGLEEQAETGASLLLDEMAALCRSAAAADTTRRAAMVSAVREGFASLCASGAATRAAVESVTEVNRLRLLRATAPLRLAPLLAATPAVAAALLPGQFGRRARQWRATFQQGLAAWLRGQDEATEPLRIVLARVSDIATESPSRALWKSAALFCDSLPSLPALASVDDRRRLARIDTALRRLADEGAGAFDEPDADFTDELLAALVLLRPQALPPRGAARAALLRFLQAELATLRAEFTTAGRAPRTTPAAVRQVADTLGLLELCGPRRRLLAAAEQLRSHNADEQKLAELSALMFELETAARQANGEPALTAPPSLARELSALAEVLAEPARTIGVEPTDARRVAARDAKLLQAVSVISEGRDRVEAGVATARLRLLDVDESTATLREALLHVELNAKGDEYSTELADLRAQLAALGTRSASLESVLRDLQMPLAAQGRAEQQLRTLLDTTSLASLGERLLAHARRGAAQAGMELTLCLDDEAEAMQLPAEGGAELLMAMLDHVLATHGGHAITVHVGCAREGAWSMPWLRCSGATRVGQDHGESSWQSAELAARRLGGVLHAELADSVGVVWARLLDPLALRSLLRIELGDDEYALPVADVRAVQRGASEQSPPGATTLDLRTVLETGRGAGPDAVLLVEVGGATVRVLVDAVEELGAGTPQRLAEPLSSVSWLAGATLVGEERLLAVLDIGELVLLQHGAASS